MSAERRAFAACRRWLCHPCQHASFNPCLLTGYSGSFFEQLWYSPVISSIKGCHCIRHEEMEKYRHHLFWICAHEAAADGQSQLEIQRRLQDIWLLLINHEFSQSNSAERRPEDNRILAMLDYLREHYAERFSLNAMAEHHHISRGECCRYFKKMMGMTITEFLLDYRLSKAAQWLTLTQMSITNISHSAGFRSASNFSAEFKKKTGKTPSEYRTCVQNHCV